MAVDGLASGISLLVDLVNSLHYSRITRHLDTILRRRHVGVGRFRPIDGVPEKWPSPVQFGWQVSGSHFNAITSPEVGSAISEGRCTRSRNCLEPDSATGPPRSAISVANDSMHKSKNV